MCEAAAKSESLISNTCHRIRNRDGGEAAAIRESALSNTCHGIRNRDGGEASASFESPISNTCNTKASLYSFVTYYSVGNNYYKLNIPYYIVKKILYYYYKGYIDFLTIFWWNRFV